MNLRLIATCSMAVLFLSACAWANRNAHVEAQGPNTGTIEVVNASPQHRINVTVFREADECRGPKVVSMFELTGGKAVREAHQAKLSMLLGVSLQADLQAVAGCSAAFTVPFQRGDLRATVGYSASEKACQFLIESRVGAEAWRPADNVVRKKVLQAFMQDGPWCGAQ